MEAVPANAPLVAPSFGHRVRRGLVRQRRVEGGVEDGDVRYVGKRLLGRVDGLERGPVVKRRENGQLSDLLLHVGSEQDGIPEARAAVDDAMADGVDLPDVCERLDSRTGLVGQNDVELEARRAGVHDEDPLHAGIIAARYC